MISNILAGNRGAHASSVLPCASCARGLGHRAECPGHVARAFCPPPVTAKWFGNIACLLFLMLLALPLRAQQGGNVSMKIDVVAWGDEIKGLSLKPGSSKGDITALGFRYSKPVAYSGPVIMAIYQSTNAQAAPGGPAMEIPGQPKVSPKPIAAGKTTAVVAVTTKPTPKQGLALELAKRRQKEPTLVALAALPGGACSRATVLLAPADDGTYIAYVIDDDPSKLPVGQVRIHNLSPFPIAMRCNGKAVQELKTRGTMLVPAMREHLVYELAYKLGDEWKMQENNVIPVHPQEQSQMIILKSSNTYFLSSDGSSGGFLELVTLRRGPAAL